jgi:signal transduction histidine kinase
MSIFERIPHATIENAGDQRRARLLNILLLGVGGITLFALVGILFANVLAGFEGGHLAIGASALLGAIALSLWLNRSGQVLPAGVIFLAAVVAVFSIADSPEQVVRGRTLFMFVIPVLMSSFLIRPAAGFVTAGIVAALHMTIASMARVEGYTPVGLIGFVVIALVAWLAAGNLEAALDSLQRTNEILDQRVAERTRDLAGANEQLLVQAHRLEDANKRLQTLDELKSRFVSDVSHELRTPIANLAIYLEMIQYGTPEENARYLQVLRDETERLNRLVSDILDLSRMEAGTSKVEMAWQDVNEIVEKVVVANRLRAEDKGLSVFFAPDVHLPHLWADAGQLTQVANNLIGNAVNYTKQGGVNVSTKHNAVTNEILLVVSDSGVGIDAADIPHLFERFYRGRQAGQSTIPGTGLGLAITKEIVDRLHGRIEVASNVGMGTQFKVYFPAALKD